MPDSFGVSNQRSISVVAFVPMVRFGMLGPLTATNGEGVPLALGGSRQRAVLARLLVARGAVVTTSTLVEDLWGVAPEGAAGAVQTFVGALRKALEPDRPRRAPSALLVTEATGYSLRATDVDAREFEADLHAGRLDAALARWRGPALADLTDYPWAADEADRLHALRTEARERRAESMIADGRAAEAIADLQALTTVHPYREPAWRLLAVSLYRTGRQADALAALRRVGSNLRDDLGIDPGPDLRALEVDILNQADHLDVHSSPVAVARGSARRLRAVMRMVEALAVTGDQHRARRLRSEACSAAEDLGDPVSTASVLGALAVPASWTTVDDPSVSARLVGVAERTLAALPDGHDEARCRLLGTIALERRAEPEGRGGQAAREAEALARRLDEPALLALALNGRFLQRFERAGLASERGAIGAELQCICDGRPELAAFAVLARLILLGACAAHSDFAVADEHAAAADALAAEHDLPVVAVLTLLYRGLRLGADGDHEAAADIYRRAANHLPGLAMPGMTNGLVDLGLLSVGAAPADADFGPLAPWVHPVGPAPQPPHDLLLEARLCLSVEHVLRSGDQDAAARLRAQLAPAEAELAGAGSGFVSFGPVADYLARLDDAL